MATVEQHNKLINIVFNGNKHLKHVLSDEDIKQMTLIEGRFPLTKLPVCGHCEKLGLWHRDAYNRKIVGVCRTCGTITKNPVTYSTYLASRMDVDETGDTFRSMATVDKHRDLAARLVYLPDFNHIGKEKGVL